VMDNRRFYIGCVEPGAVSLRFTADAGYAHRLSSSAPTAPSDSACVLFVSRTVLLCSVAVVLVAICCVVINKPSIRSRCRCRE
jgi:hypothetical protein